MDGMMPWKKSFFSSLPWVHMNLSNVHLITNPLAHDGCTIARGMLWLRSFVLEHVLLHLDANRCLELISMRPMHLLSPVHLCEPCLLLLQALIGRSILLMWT